MTVNEDDKLKVIEALQEAEEEALKGQQPKDAKSFLHEFSMLDKLAKEILKRKTNIPWERDNE